MDRERLFGSDLRIIERAAGMDLITNGAGDLAMAAGNSNIAQALLLRLRIRKGELAQLGWPDYGSRLHELIGEPNNTRTQTKLMAFARTAVEQDPRVREVLSARCQMIPGERDTVRLVLDVALIDEPNPLNLVYDQKLG